MRERRESWGLKKHTRGKRRFKGRSRRNRDIGWTRNSMGANRKVYTRRKYNSSLSLTKRREKFFYHKSIGDREKRQKHDQVANLIRDTRSNYDKAAIVIAGDFNEEANRKLRSGAGLEEIVKAATKKRRAMDKIFVTKGISEVIIKIRAKKNLGHGALLRS